MILLADDLKDIPRPLAAILVKPFHLSTMLHTIRRVLRADT
jgi:hypothetical protein